MTPVPPEVEEAARDLARSEYDVTDAEVDALAADHRFAVAAYLRRETFDHLDALRPDFEAHGVDAAGDLDRDALPEAEVEAFRCAYAAAGALSDATDRLADAALDREVRTLSVGEVLVAVAADGGEA